MKKSPIPEQSEEFNELVNLLAVYSEAHHQLATIESRANEDLLELVDEHKADYAKLQSTLLQAESAIEAIARSHPEWFPGTRTIKTPYGKISFRRSTSLESTNEEATVRLLRAEAASKPEFDADQFIRQAQAPKLEAMETWSDDELARFMVRRVKRENFSVSASQVEFGKAVSDTQPKEA